MANPHAIPIVLSEADRGRLQGWARRHKTAQALARRARIVLACAAPGATNGGVAAALGVSRPTVALWRQRFAERGRDGLLDEPRSGAPRRITDEQVERAVTTTLEASPPDATHWSTRSLARAAGLSQTAVCRIWRAFALKCNSQHLIGQFGLAGAVPGPGKEDAASPWPAPSRSRP
jgi:transposase